MRVRPGWSMTLALRCCDTWSRSDPSCWTPTGRHAVLLDPGVEARGRGLAHRAGRRQGDTWSSWTPAWRHVVEVWLTTPIVLLGIAGNVVAFFVLCQHRRHKLQTTTAILQVGACGARRDCGSNVSI